LRREKKHTRDSVQLVAHRVVTTTTARYKQLTKKMGNVMTQDVYTWPDAATPEVPTLMTPFSADLLPTSTHRRRRSNPTKLLPIVGSILVVLALVGVIASQQSSLNHVHATLASTQSSLKTTTTTLTDTQANLTSTQNDLATATADAAKAKADLSGVQSQLSTAQASSAACQTFVGDADNLIQSNSDFLRLINQFDTYQSYGDLGGEQRVLDAMNANVDSSKALLAQYKISKAACFGGADSGSGSNA
jgi:hypothetical protein